LSATEKEVSEFQQPEAGEDLARVEKIDGDG
jgi:hypothetical protein